MFLKKLIYSFRIMEPLYPLCGGIVLLVLGAVMMVSSACHPMYSLLLLPRNALPYWLFAGTGLLLFFLLGACAGMLFAIPGCKCGVCRPLIGVVAMTILMFVWYHILFRSLNIVTACILLVIVLLLEIISIGNTARNNQPAMLLLMLTLPITLHFMWFNVGLIFLN